MTNNINAFVEEQLHLLTIMEREEKMNFHQLIKNSENSVPVEVMSWNEAEHQTGSTVIKFQPTSPLTKLTKLKRGEPVLLKKCNANIKVKGIINKVKYQQYDIHIDQVEGTDLNTLDKWSIIKIFNKQHRNMETSIKKIIKNKNPLRDILFGMQEPSYKDIENPATINMNLDVSQRQAVNFALSQNELAIIHGPPGTGKTTVLTEIILQSIMKGEKILVTASSNIAVDNLGGKLLCQGIEIVKLGHPARSSNTIAPYCLQILADKVSKSKDVPRTREIGRAHV